MINIGDKVQAQPPGRYPFVGTVINREPGDDYGFYAMLTIEGDRRDYPVETDKNPVIRCSSRWVKKLEEETP